ncbi:conserved hypothetical protein [uncultured Spirochaetota bacterium]|jgi:hypothetical protein|uniref:Uncharacterized protein n=1 Tax=uncultured Spirochaetota bacterium TaxID=460511 RepID=A0A652ZVG3_9SPIR|nr:conserved hypothetical protein [uncultured Spirochaetota bacterium]
MKKTKKPASTRSLIARSILLALYIAVMLIMVITGRRHTILIDNKDAPDGSYMAIDGMEVQIDNQEALEYYPGDRDKAVVQGQRHKIKVDMFMEGREFEASFRIPFGQDMILLSVPKLAAGIEPYFEPFTVLESIASDAANEAPTSFGADSPVGLEEGPPVPELIQ